MKTRRTLAACGFILVAGVIAGGARLPQALAWPPLRRMLVAQGFHAAMAENARMAALVQAPVLRAVLCGTASPLPVAGRAGPCAAVLAGGHIWLVDAGGGGWRNIMLWHLPGEKLAGVLLTHFHSDHIEDLGEANLQSWIAGRAAPLAVYGGPGIASVVDGFNAAYAQDTGYRVAHHSKAMMPPEASTMMAHQVANAAGGTLAEGETAPVLEQDGLRITAIGVNHLPVSPAYAYRFDYKGRSLVISGDTRASPAFADAVRGVEVMIHEAQANEVVSQIHDLMAAQGNARLASMLNDIKTYHTGAGDAGRMADRAGARLLVLTHLTPAMPAWFGDAVFGADLRLARQGESLVGYDGLMLSLPGESTAIEESTLR